MKKCSILAPLLLGFVTASVQAGQEVYKQVAPPPPPPPLYGTGFYGAIDAGANVYQNTFDSRTFTQNFPDLPFFGSSLEVSPQHDVGVFGGIKLGYVFGTGVVRPTVEGDFFYNGFNLGANLTIKDPVGDVVASAHPSDWVNSGAFMANFILRFAPGNQRFQPYVGAGVGVYYAKFSNFELHIPATEFFGNDEVTFNSHADLAWQVVAGADYYWTPKFSTFIEYHYLDYTTTFASATGSDFLTRRGFEVHIPSFDLGQHLVGAGVRFHF
jgi:opacity protein-like surface antigen